MNLLLKTFAFLVLLGWVSNVFAQCQDSSDATLKETTNWLVEKINGYGGRALPPTNYRASADSAVITIYELGLNENFEIKDTINVCQFNLKDLDLTKMSVRYLNKNNTRFALKLELKKQKAISYSKTLFVYNSAYEILINCTQEMDLPLRFIKAIRHGYCLAGGNKEVKEKF